MGRQIGIAATALDEAQFLDFVRSTAPIRIANSAAPSLEELWVDGFSPELAFHRQYWIWNCDFAWQPSYGRVQADAPGNGGWLYIQNVHTAPVMEFWRTDWNQKHYGRLYWSKSFAAPDGLDYEVNAFSRWYDGLVRWVRKNGKKVISSSYEPYFLPDAWASQRSKK